jgi:DNA-binding GntR family transcriptional regulator
MIGDVSDRSRLSFAVRDEIASRISSGDIGPGNKLPPEPQLATELGVSRATLREALRSLEEDGFVRRTRGSGTFATHRPRLRNNLDINFGVTEAIRAAGMEPGTSERTVRTGRASSDVSRRLAITAGDRVIVVERVRTADGRPVVYSRDIMPVLLFEGRPEAAASFTGESVYEFLESELGLHVHQGVASFQPVKADRRIASKLRVIRGVLLLYFRQVDYDASGRPVLYSHEYHLADAFEYTVVRRGPSRSR